MGFLDEVRAETRTHKQCKLCDLLAELPENERAEIDEVLADKSVEVPPIVRALLKRGIDVHTSTAYRHRQRCCGVA